MVVDGFLCPVCGQPKAIHHPTCPRKGEPVPQVPVGVPSVVEASTSEAPAAKAVRMLTKPEVVRAIINHWHKDDDEFNKDYAEEIQRKFCEVNGLSLSGAAGVPQELGRDDVQFLIDLAAKESVSAFERRTLVRIARQVALPGPVVPQEPSADGVRQVEGPRLRETVRIALNHLLQEIRWHWQTDWKGDAVARAKHALEMAQERDDLLELIPAGIAGTSKASEGGPDHG